MRAPWTRRQQALKSLKEFGLQPHWEPSEEPELANEYGQMDAETN